MAGDRDDEGTGIGPRAAQDPFRGPAPEVVTGPSTESAAVRQARAAIEADQPTRARAILTKHVATQRDAEALKLLGEVLHRAGDLSGAGAVWFATSAKGPLVDEAVNAWRARHHDDFGAMWESLPAAVRAEPLTPRLAALRAKAAEAAPKPKTETVREPRVERAKPESAEPESAEPESARNVPAKHAEARVTSAEPKRPAPVRPQPKDITPHRMDAEPVDETVEPPSGGFDAAKVIAWLLAAFFVVCAVVGLITILRWIVPGG